jgi:hypothetical protein
VSGGLSFTVLRDGIFTHPTAAEGIYCAAAGRRQDEAGMKRTWNASATERILDRAIELTQRAIQSPSSTCSCPRAAAGVT